jgi:hypothetical protein
MTLMIVQEMEQDVFTVTGLNKIILAVRQKFQQYYAPVTT